MRLGAGTNSAAHGRPLGRHLAHVLREYCQHYNTHRPHRSLHQHPPTGRLATAPHGLQNRPLRRDRLGGLIHEYLRVA
jgi:hypothetical protein